MRSSDIKPFLLNLRERLVRGEVQAAIEAIDQAVAPKRPKAEPVKRSKYKHVYWSEAGRRWVARMTIRGETQQFSASIDEDKCYQMMVQKLTERGLVGLLGAQPHE